MEHLGKEKDQVGGWVGLVNDPTCVLMGLRVHRGEGASAKAHDSAVCLGDKKESRHLGALITISFITHPPNLRHGTGQQEGKGKNNCSGTGASLY